MQSYRSPTPGSGGDKQNDQQLLFEWLAVGSPPARVLVCAITMEPWAISQGKRRFLILNLPSVLFGTNRGADALPFHR